MMLLMEQSALVLDVDGWRYNITTGMCINQFIMSFYRLDKRMIYTLAFQQLRLMRKFQDK
jgi:hypothetical protein